MSRPTLIINADDLGLCPEVDAGILQCVEAGVVTAASLLVAPPFAADLGAIRRSGVSLGLHLSLSLGSPVLPAERVPSLVEPDGEFIVDLPLLLRRFRPADAAAEMTAQLDRFRALVGAAPSHLNFHKHLHARDPRLFELLLDLAAPIRTPVRTLNSAMRDRCRERGVPSADRFVGDVAAGGYWTSGRLETTLRSLLASDSTGSPGTRVIELMCHPGLPMEPRPGIWYGSERDVERQTFLSAEVPRLLEPFDLAGFSPGLFPENPDR